MKELPDSEFDRLFREKSEQFDYSFEEEAWGMMEKKLRRRDRFIAFRNSGLILLLLLLSGSAYYLLMDQEKAEFQASRRSKTTGFSAPAKKAEYTEAGQTKTDVISDKGFAGIKQPQVSTKKRAIQLAPGSGKKESEISKKNRREEKKKILPAEVPPADYAHLKMLPTASHLLAPDVFEPEIEDKTGGSGLSPKTKPGTKTWSLSFTAGPDFSSISSIAGKKANLGTGLLLSYSLKKITLSTGMRYGIKDYLAESYDYNLSNPARAPQISGIDGSCKVLEIPLQASYLIHADAKGKISASTGISSYLMLKEKYLFRYTPQSGRKDYLLEKDNENQHYFSVLSLGALYQFKPISKDLRMGIEPYVKIPLGGVGEGNVRLKSSGISLNLTYVLSEKN